MSETLVHTGQAVGWYRCDGKDCPVCGPASSAATPMASSLPPQSGQPSDLAAQLIQVRATLEKARKFVRGRHSTIPYGPMQLVVEIDIALGLLDAVAMNESASQNLPAAAQPQRESEK